jgi:hypothetical protein
MISPLLDEREITHGDYATKCRFIQAFKQMIRHAEGFDDLSPAQRESLDMIATKIGRILHGDPNHKDSWLDVSGYAELIWREIP